MIVSHANLPSEVICSHCGKTIFGKFSHWFSLNLPSHAYYHHYKAEYNRKEDFLNIWTGHSIRINSKLYISAMRCILHSSNWVCGCFVDQVAPEQYHGQSHHCQSATVRFSSCPDTYWIQIWKMLYCTQVQCQPPSCNGENADVISYFALKTHSWQFWARRSAGPLGRAWGSSGRIASGRLGCCKDQIVKYI